MILLVNDGVRLDQFNSSAKSDAHPKAFLDWYNSYSRTLVSFVAAPIEMCLGMTLAVSWLCFATSFIGRTNETLWWQQRIDLIPSVAVAFLVLSGLSALNVKLVSGAITEQIVAEDLSLKNQPIVDTQALGAGNSLATMLDKAYRENATDNPVPNTILRNVITPMDSVPAT
uniref:Uncharacterized protein n=1 Tax=Globisporangium ultimum (strain ATCC 200006 / CBS 805.95 / DAOM BR144) TaxID=431595 RepID=K3WZT8_GLOUD